MQVQFTANVTGNGKYWMVDDLLIIGDEAFTPGNIGSELYVESGTGTTVENNIFYTKNGSDYYAVHTETGITIASDYNSYFANSNTNLFNYDGTIDNTGPMQINDLTSNPDFVSAGTDFHIISLNDSYHGGSWPPITAFGGTWETDLSDSPALNAGNPADPYTNEPQAGGRINQGAYGNTAQASKSAIIDFTWNGSTDTDWQTPANWSPVFIPSGGDNVAIPDVLLNDPIIDDDDLTAVCNDLQIESGAVVTIAPNGQMTVYGVLTNTDGITGLILQSDDTGDASLIQSTVGINASVQRYLGTGTIPEWHFISSPISDASVSLFPTNFYYYLESTDDWWTGSTLFGTSGWTVPSGTMTPALGYINYHTSTTTPNFQGTLNYQASYSMPASYTDHGGNAANGEPYTNFDGWTLIGNPYTSALDWEAIDKTDDITPTVYFYNDGLSNYTYYQDGGLSVNSGSRYIPSMQGFFIKTNDATGGGNIIIPSTARVHSSQTYWKSSKTIDNLIKLRIDYNGYSDETIIRFKENATNDFDDQFDAYKRFSWNDDVIQIYTFNPGINTDLAVNTVNDEDVITIPLAYKVNTDDKFTFYSNEFNFDDYSVFLYDIEEDIYTEFSLGQTYTFNSEQGTFTDRFELIFEKSTVFVPQSFNTSVVLFPNPNSGIFYLSVGNNASDYTVEITNITGRIVYKNTFENNFTKEINMNSQSGGVYFVKIRFSDNSVVNKKIIVQ